MERSNVRRGAVWFALMLSVAAVGCGESSPTDAGGGGGSPVVTTSVAVSDNQFAPQAIQVSPGATVTWTWGAGSSMHNVTFSSGSIGNSGDQATGTFTSAMPQAAGVYSYVCTIHSGMTGTVTVP